MLTQRVQQLIITTLMAVLVAGYITVITPVLGVAATPAATATPAAQLPTLTPSPVLHAPTLTSTPVLPQPGAFFCGIVETGEGEPGGAISFQVSADSASISGLEIAMAGTHSSIECSNGSSVEVSGTVTQTFAISFAIQGSLIDIELLADRKLTGQFNSPTEARGEVEMVLTLPGLADTKTCNFGSWNWTVQTCTPAFTQATTLSNTPSPTQPAPSEAAALVPTPTIPPTPPMVRAAGWEEIAVQTLCLEVEQFYPEAEEKSPEPVAETIERLLAKVGVQVVSKESSCQATLTLSLTGQAQGGNYIPGGYCYSGAEFNGLAEFTAADHIPLTMSITATFPPPSTISNCPKEPINAPFGSAWQKGAVEPLIELWGLPVLSAALLDEDFQVRQVALMALEEIRPEAKQLVPILIEALNNQDSLIRQTTAEALGKLGPEEGIIPALIQALEDEESWVRRSAAEALGKLGPEEGVIPALIQTLKDEERSVRVAAIEALGQIGPDADVVLALVEVLETNEDWWERMIIVKALGEIGPGAKEAVPALIKALSDEDGMVQMYASSALNSITEQDFGENAARWQQWWQEQR